MNPNFDPIVALRPSIGTSLPRERKDPVAKVEYRVCGSERPVDDEIMSERITHCPVETPSIRG